MSHLWSDDEVEVLKAHWLKGLSFGAIGNMLRRGRGSVAGKLHRLGLSKPRSRAEVSIEPKQPVSLPKPSVPVDLQKWTQAMERKPDDVSLPFYHSDPIPGHPPVSLLEAKNFQCRWVVKEGEVEGFCGIHTDHGSWCEHHAKLAFTSPTISNARFIRAIARNPNL